MTNIATPEQVENYLKKFVGDNGLRASLDEHLENLRNNTSALLVENEIQKLRPADFADLEADAQEEWEVASEERIAQYEKALKERAHVISMLEDKLAALPNADWTPQPNRAERRRRDQDLAKKLEK